MKHGIKVVQRAFRQLNSMIPLAQHDFSRTRFSRYTLRALAALLLVAVPASVTSYAVHTDGGGSSQLEPRTRGISNESSADIGVSAPVTSPSATTSNGTSGSASASSSSSNQSSSRRQTNNRADVTVEVNGRQIAVPENGEVHHSFNDGTTNSNVDVSVRSSGNASSSSSSSTNIEINSTSTSEGDAP